VEECWFDLPHMPATGSIRESEDGTRYLLG